MTKIAVIGEAFTDRYWLGSTNRLSAEAPIPVVKCDGTLTFWGGAGNVAENVKSLGAQPLAFYQPNDCTPVKNRLMVGNHQLARWDEDDTADPLSEERLHEIAVNVFGCDGVILSDYGKGMFTPRVINSLAFMVGTLPVFIDTKQDPFLFAPFHEPFWFPNLAEYRQYRSSYEDLENVVLKRGAEGLQFGDIKIPAMTNRVVSVNGAGDTVIAAFAVFYTNTRDVHNALAAATRAAAIAVSKPYTTAVTFEELGTFDGFNRIRAI